MMTKPFLLPLLLAVMMPVATGCRDRLIPPDDSESIWSGRSVIYNGFNILSESYGPIYIQSLDATQDVVDRIIPDGYIPYPARGGAFLYIRDDGSGPELYIHANNTDRLLVRGPGGAMTDGRAVAVLSDDGSTVAYLQRGLFLDTALYLCIVSATNPAAVPDTAPIAVGEVRSMLFSPDGNYIAMSIINPDGISEDIHVYDRNSRQIIRQISNRLPDTVLPLASQSLYWFQWMPDSRGIVYRGLDPIFGSGIFVSWLDIPFVWPIARDESYSFPTPSPTGGHIAAIRDGQLWLMNIDGSNQRKFSHAPLGDVDIALGLQWSADGSKILINRANIDINRIDIKAVVEVLDIATGRRKALASIEAPGLWYE